MSGVAGKKIFRIEKYQQALPDSEGGAENPVIESPAGDSDLAARRHEEVMAAIASIASVGGNVQGEEQRPSAEGELTAKIIEDYKTDLLEARKLKDELHRIYEAIARTKKEIVTMQHSGVQGMEMNRVSDELGAVVEGTETATEQILDAAEQIDQKAGDLAAALSDAAQKDLASDIQDHVVKIFEASNFQDLTGQRITKVVRAFGFIETRVENMLEIWGGISSFKDVEPHEPERQSDHDEFLNGPALERDEDVASQDDIDALFD